MSTAEASASQPASTQQWHLLDSIGGRYLACQPLRSQSHSQLPPFTALNPHQQQCGKDHRPTPATTNASPPPSLHRIEITAMDQASSGDIEIIAVKGHHLYIFLMGMKEAYYRVHPEYATTHRWVIIQAHRCFDYHYSTSHYSSRILYHACRPTSNSLVAPSSPQSKLPKCCNITQTHWATSLWQNCNSHTQVGFKQWPTRLRWWLSMKQM